MKIGVLSDTHMMQKCIDKTIPYLKECDLILHAGDNFSDSKYIHSQTNVDIIAVKGNCDFEYVEDEIIFDIEGKNIFLCHGDKYDVKYGIDIIEKKAKSIGADVVVFGHTHTPLNISKDGILYLNPGSTSLPRGVLYKSMCLLNIKYDKIEVKEIKL